MFVRRLPEYDIPDHDVLGYRKKFGVIGPSTNTIVQPDFEALRPIGVTNHYSRIFTADASAISNESFMSGTLAVSERTLDAAKAAATCAPDCLVMGMSAITFYGGAKGEEKWRENLEGETGLKLITGSISLVAALSRYPHVKKIAVISPYFPVANDQVIRFLSDFGYEVVRDCCLRCPSWTAIARVPEQTLSSEIMALDGDDIDAIVQVGTNLSMINLAAAAELFLRKPVIAINTATYWNALRTNGIDDKLTGYGSLLDRN